MQFKTAKELDAMSEAERIAYWRAVEYEYQYVTDDDAKDDYKEKLTLTERNALSLLR